MTELSLQWFHPVLPPPWKFTTLDAHNPLNVASKELASARSNSDQICPHVWITDRDKLLGSVWDIGLLALRTQPKDHTGLKPQFVVSHIGERRSQVFRLNQFQSNVLG